MATLIRTPQDLHNIRNDPTDNYELANDIDMSDWGNWQPIGGSSSSQRFRGNFDGKGHTIKNITIKDNDYNSIFGYVGTANIKNLRVENAISNSQSTYTAILFSYFFGNSGDTISNIHVSGEVNGKYNVGGLGGYIYRGTVKDCYSTANVSGETVGGLVRYVLAFGYVENSFATGKLTSTINDYSTIGGLVQSGVSSNITNSYWDIDSSGITTSIGGEGKTTAEMKDQSTYVGWDFDSVWGIDGDYPYLQVLGIPDTPDPISNVTSVELRSHSNNIVSNVSKSVNSNRTIQSYLLPLVSKTMRHTAALRLGNTFISKLNSNAAQTSRSVRSSTAQVRSFIKPVHSMIERKVKSKQSLSSHIIPLRTSTSVLIPLSDEVVNAYLSWLENHSTATHKTNSTFTNHIENPSILEVQG